MIRFFLIITFFFVVSCGSPESNTYGGHTPSYVSQTSSNVKGFRVVRIKDGDTFVLLIDGRERVVRLMHIDCPEKKQPFGDKAKQFASTLCFGMYVTLVHNNQIDRNGRLIAEVTLDDGTNVNKALVKNGLAWHFKKYSNNADYALLEINARKSKIGIWSMAHPVAPWDWRK